MARWDISDLNKEATRLKKDGKLEGAIKSLREDKAGEPEKLPFMVWKSPAARRGARVGTGLQKSGARESLHP